MNEGLQNTIKQYAPAFVKTAYHYLLYRLRYRRMENGAIILNSIRKSGTFYFRFLLTNYLFLSCGKSTGPISYEEMQQRIFPNRLFEVPHRVQPAGHVIKSFHYEDFIYGHDYTFLKYSSASKIIHLYRNPLDTVVSRFFYTWKNRVDEEKKSMYQSPREVLDIVLSQFISHYKYLRDLAGARANVMRIPYEILMRSTRDVLIMVFSWLNLPIDHSLIEKAIEYSSKEEIRKQEKKRGASIVSELEGSFVRSGTIGEWKEYLSEEDVQYVRRRLKDENILLEEFITE